tara:strand:+ start:344 stop:490 length:147 start_codon:yes stop_codon:yes gene_type:complete
MDLDNKEKKIKIRKKNADEILAINHDADGNNISNVRSGITYIPKKNGK